MTSLTFYGGVNEVGGNKILLQDKDTKIFIDFDKHFTFIPLVQDTMKRRFWA